jgi:hypothetical protein
MVKMLIVHVLRSAFQVFFDLKRDKGASKASIQTQKNPSAYFPHGRVDFYKSNRRLFC